MSTYFLLDPFEFPYYFYRILGELIYVLSIVVCIPSTFCPTLGHHLGRIYYKNDVTFVLAYYYGVRASLPLKIMAFARDTFNYGQYLNQFPPPNNIKVIREFERIQKKICRHKMSIMFNEICINEEMLPKYTHTHTHTHIYIYIYICMYFFKKKQRNRSHRIINLFPSCYAFLKFPKTRKKINRTSSDLFDKKTRIDT